MPVHSTGAVNLHIAAASFISLVPCYHEALQAGIKQNQRGDSFNRYVLKTVLLSLSVSLNVGNVLTSMWVCVCKRERERGKGYVCVLMCVCVLVKRCMFNVQRAYIHSIHRSVLPCSLNCINMKCRCIIDETSATFTVRACVVTECMNVLSVWPNTFFFYAFFFFTLCRLR